MNPSGLDGPRNFCDAESSSEQVPPLVLVPGVEALEGKFAQIQLVMSCMMSLMENSPMFQDNPQPGQQAPPPQHQLQQENPVH